MACSLDHLKKVAFGRQAVMAAHRHAPPQRNQDHHHHQNLVPNQYVYHGPEVVTVFLQPDTGSYQEIQTTKNYDRWYVCKVYQAPTAAAATAAVSSNDAAAFYGEMLLDD